LRIHNIVACTRTISFEFFPPKDKSGMIGVLEKIKSLKSYSPDFISITYGAGGYTRRFSEELIMQVKAEHDLEVMAHLTCIGHSVDELDAILRRWDKSGIDNIIALRGDLPKDGFRNSNINSTFQYASDLIKFIDENYSFCIGAACYPECHPESISIEDDLSFAKLKVENGAEFLITQLFYDNDDFYRFVERARSQGITVPIIPGVLPVLSAKQTRRFTSLCGARIPSNLAAKLNKYENDDKSARAMGVDYAIKQVESLWDYGVCGVHFYVLNRSYSVSKILDSLKLDRQLI
tara:strand:- start:1017 stop:1892 length:876 start_codon:yes stop_codon:yes gene_type:complete